MLKSILWFIAVALVAVLIVAWIVAGFYGQWALYSQFAQGLGQEPDVWGYIGFLITTGGSK